MRDFRCVNSIHQNADKRINRIMFREMALRENYLVYRKRRGRNKSQLKNIKWTSGGYFGSSSMALFDRSTYIFIEILEWFTFAIFSHSVLYSALRLLTFASQAL